MLYTDWWVTLPLERLAASGCVWLASGRRLNVSGRLAVWGTSGARMGTPGHVWTSDTSGTSGTSGGMVRHHDHFTTPGLTPCHILSRRPWLRKYEP
eukprot:3611698-Prymnesium_polylepis.1